MRRIISALLATACLATALQAQAAGRREDEDTLPPSKPPALSTLPPSKGIAGPKLEPGAVVCHTEADLQHRLDVNQRRVDGEADPGDPLVGCRILAQASGVEVVARHGLAHTQIKLKPAGEIGWTDTYLH